MPFSFITLELFQELELFEEKKIKDSHVALIT